MSCTPSRPSACSTRASRARAKPVTSSETCTVRGADLGRDPAHLGLRAPVAEHQAPAAGAQLAVERLEAAEHPRGAGMGAKAPAQQRGIEDEERHDPLVLAAGVRERGQVAHPQVAAKPDDGRVGHRLGYGLARPPRSLRLRRDLFGQEARRQPAPRPRPRAARARRAPTSSSRRFRPAGRGPRRAARRAAASGAPSASAGCRGAGGRRTSPPARTCHTRRSARGRWPAGGRGRRRGRAARPALGAAPGRTAARRRGRRSARRSRWPAPGGRRAARARGGAGLGSSGP